MSMGGKRNNKKKKLIKYKEKLLPNKTVYSDNVEYNKIDRRWKIQLNQQLENHKVFPKKILPEINAISIQI